MRVRSFSDLIGIAAIWVILSCTLGAAVADTGGGKGYPATPWRTETPESVVDIEKAKAVAATYQTISVPAKLVNEKWKDGNNLIHVERVALIAQQRRDSDTPLYELVGKTSAGADVSLSFSQIESFSVTSKDDQTLTISVTVWPDISAEELLTTQPTYKQLRAGYRHNVILIMRLKSSDGRPVAFANKLTAIPLENFVVGTKGDFYAEHPHRAHPRRFWWAIPSVTEDKDYPFRVVPLAVQESEIVTVCAK